MGQFLLLVAVGALLAGFLGGLGGRYWALRSVRGELRFALATVDLDALRKLPSLGQQLLELDGRQEATREAVASVKGTLAQLAKRDKLGPDDLAFLTAAVLERIKAGALLKAVP